MLRATFVRRRGSRDRVYVTRTDGTSTGWDFPSYGDGLPHDLCHLVVEHELRLANGFWGLVDEGVEVRLVNNEATLVRDGERLVDLPDVDLSGLLDAEAAVAALAGPGRIAGSGFGPPLPPGVAPDVVDAIDTRLRALAARWRDLDNGGAITLEFARA